MESIEDRKKWAVKVVRMLGIISVFNLVIGGLILFLGESFLGTLFMFLSIPFFLMMVLVKDKE